MGRNATPRGGRARAARTPKTEVEFVSQDPIADAAIKSAMASDAAPPVADHTRKLLYVATGIFALMALYALYFAGPVLVPIAFAILLSMLFSPLMKLFDRYSIPRPAGAALSVVLLIAIVGGTAYALSGPVLGWMAKVPSGAAGIEEKLEFLKKPLAEISKATQEIEQATELQGEGAQPKVQVASRTLSERFFSGGAKAAASAAAVVVLLFFLLASGDSFLRKLVTIIPTLRDKKQAVEMVRDIEDGISFYLLLLTLTNLCLGLGVALIAAMLGLPDPLLWGALTVILSFAPYVGELAVALALLVASLLTFDTLAASLAAPAAYLVMMMSVHVATPLIIRRRLLLSPVAVFIAIIVFGWMWGVPGALLAVPLLASFKVVCEHIEGLNPIAAFLTA